MATIRDAFSHWADNTCLRFKEVPTDQHVSTNHLLITAASSVYQSIIKIINDNSVYWLFLRQKSIRVWTIFIVKRPKLIFNVHGTNLIAHVSL